MTSPRHIAVLKGGWSAEREVSLVSGAAAAKALRERGHQVTEIDVTRDLPALIAALSPAPDVVFNALHGRGGEDGTVQAILDMLALPYTHSGVLSSAVAMDKAMTRDVVRGHGVAVADGKLVSAAELQRGLDWPRPYVVKPVNEGSSVGVHLVREGANSLGISAEELARNSVWLVERYVPGRELTVGVMSERHGLARAMAVTEIRPKVSFYDYTAKYTDGFADHVIPAEIPPLVEQKIRWMAETAHRALGCRGVSRSDFRWDDTRPGADGLYFLEINTQPGMTPLSLVPEQAQYLGMSFADLVEWMVEAATWP